MKYTNAQIARHLAVKEADIRETAEREATGEIVVILSDFRKLVFPASALKGDPDPAVSYTHLRAHETVLDLVCRLLLEKKTKTR